MSPTIRVLPACFLLAACAGAPTAPAPRLAGASGLERVWIETLGLE
jgi:hypothetical protein